MVRAVFLDRDGVINRAPVNQGVPGSPMSVDEMKILDGVPEAIAALKDAGFLVIVITNQPDVGNGIQSREIVEQMHAHLLSRMPIDEIKTCYHIDADGCACRKPAPGLIVQAGEKYGIDLGASFVVGDRWRDIRAGKAAGCYTYFIDYGYREDERIDADQTVASLADAAKRILKRAPSDIPDISKLKVKIYADGADFDSIKALYANPLIKGFTTNPTLMYQAGVKNYAEFAHKFLALVKDRPVSFEVFADDFDEMEKQAYEIASWGENVFVKIPVTNTKGEFAGPTVGKLSAAGVQVNVTAMFSLDQVRAIAEQLAPETAAIVSVFAGRVADSGIDPVPHMAAAVEILKDRPKAELLWASPRELLNILQADGVGCHIITVTSGLLDKIPLIGKDQAVYSLETVKMFFDDAQNAGYQIEITDESIKRASQ